MIKKLPLLLLFFFFIQFSFAQVGIGTTNPSASSALEIRSTNSGLLIPRVALTSSTDITTIPAPATSLMIYNTSAVSDITPGFYYWEGSWKKFSSGTTPTATTGGWNLTGNTVTSTDYLGTNNYFPLIFRVNGNQFSRFHPNGGLALGIGATANDNNSVAIGTSATATTSNQAVAIGPSANAAGYQSVAIGLNSATSNNSNVAIGSSSNASGHQSFSFGLSSASSNNNAFAIGNSSSASGQQALAIGQEANSSGQNATAIGYQATTSQSNAIVLGNSANANNKIGIGTNAPDERLHVVGSFKLVDGTQSNNFILTSDANGRASWKNPNTINYGWSLTGNAALSTDFLGTTNAIPLVFRVNNNQFARFHQTGGFAIGNGAAANDTNSIAIGTSATATTNNQATAIGQSSNASGYQATAIGLNAAASNNSAVAVGNSASASGQNAAAFGVSASASGQNATAIGYQATSSQANAVILGNSGDGNARVGIGTNTPDEKLHVVGSLKLVDGTQANNYILTSDANGRASWKAPASSSATGWSLSGNTVTAADYLGTNNYFPLIFRVNNSQFARFHPGGGLAIGSGAAASDTNGIAIGTSATATNNNQAIAIGQSSNASGYQSVAVGYQSIASNNSAAAFGLSANASGQSSTAVGYQTAASGQNSTAIGYQATTAQANAIVLGSTSTNSKIGIGINNPDERLHVAGSVKIVDGTQANNYVLTSDAGGKASWKDINANKAYAELSRNSNLQVPSGTIAFTNTGENANMNSVDVNNGIQIKTAGIYRVSYSLSVANSSIASANISFFLHNGSNEMGTTRTYQTVAAANNESISFTKLIYLNTNQTVTLRSEAANTNVNILGNSASLMVELVK